jgi:rhamnose transport system substrate-binding protein
MKKALLKPKYSKMKLLEVVYGDDEPEKSTTEMEALIVKYPTLSGVIAPTSVGVHAAAKVLQTKELGSKIALVGLGIPSELRQFIKDGTMKKFNEWNMVNEGYLAGYYACALARGEVKLGPGSTFKAGKLGMYTVTKKDQIISGPPLTFNASNVDNYDF